VFLAVTHRASCQHIRPLRFIAAIVAALSIAGAAQAAVADAAVLDVSSAAAGQPLPPDPRRNLVLPRKPRSMADFMTMVIRNVHGFWTQALGREPAVRYWWFNKKSVRSACGRATRDNPFYCPADDTIYISSRFARRVWLGRVEGQGGATLGDLGVATVVAHEYAHNVQEELSVYESHPNATQAKPFELEADCMAGMWANHAYYQGILEFGDPEEGAATSAAVGDYEVNDPNHHGTPAERAAAWMLGYNTGDPAECGSYLAGA
jgi:uncharacterized protein